MKDEQIKPCPFCGGENVMAEGQENWVAMVCQTCQAQGPKLFSSDSAFVTRAVETVTEWWDRREPKDHQWLT